MNYIYNKMHRKTIGYIIIYVSMCVAAFIIVNVGVSSNMDKYFKTFTNTTCEVIGSRVVNGDEYPTIKYMVNNEQYIESFYTSGHYVTGDIFKCYYSPKNPKHVWLGVPYYKKKDGMIGANVLCFVGVVLFAGVYMRIVDKCVKC